MLITRVCVNFRSPFLLSRFVEDCTEEAGAREQMRLQLRVPPHGLLTRSPDFLRALPEYIDTLGAAQVKVEYEDFQ